VAATTAPPTNVLRRKPETPVIAKVVVVAFVRRVLPVSVVEAMTAERFAAKAPPTLSAPLMVEDAVTVRAEVVAEVRETKPPLTALSMPPMVEEAEIAREPEVVPFPKVLFPTELKEPPIVVEPKIETAPALVKVKSVVVAEVAEVEATAMRN
jgi:hypothetical protein